MSNEQVREIIKSHILGMANAEIAKINDVTEDEVTKIINDNADQVKEISEFIKKMGG